MKVCPLCSSEYSDRIDFCFHDGAVLEVATMAAPTEDSAFDVPEPVGLGVPQPPGITISAEPDESDFEAPRPLELIDLPKRRPRPVDPGDEPPVESPLIAPPPPPRSGHEVAASPSAPPSSTAETPDSAASREAAPASSASQPHAQDSQIPARDGQRRRGPSPIWIVAVAAVLLLAVLGVGAFAIGGAGLLAMMGSDKDHSASPPAAPADPAPRRVEPLEFPEDPPPKLQLGVQKADSDGDPDTEPSQDPDGTEPDSGELDPGEPDPDSPDPDGLADAEPEPAELRDSSEPGDQGSAEPVQAPAPPEPTEAPEPEPRPDPIPTENQPRSPVTKPAAPVEAVEAVEVQVTMPGGGEGVGLEVDGVRQQGTFPFKLHLPPGRYAFKVIPPSGNSITVTKVIEDEGKPFLVQFPVLK